MEPLISIESNHVSVKLTGLAIQMAHRLGGIQQCKGPREVCLGKQTRNVFNVSGYIAAVVQDHQSRLKPQDR